MATLADLSGAEAPTHLDSLSIAPTLLASGSQAEHDYLYFEFHERGVDQAVILDGRWKGLRLKNPAEPIALYDLANDIGEANNVAAAHPDVVARIAEILAEAHEPNDHWRIEAVDAEAANRN
jgi:arylsulfatase A-like enzyme